LLSLLQAPLPPDQSMLWWPVLFQLLSSLPSFEEVLPSLLPPLMPPLLL
jgi:hypothetical protein